MKDSYHALLKIVEDLSAREFIQENESMMSEQKFYERIANITREARMSVLRDVIAGHGILMKESEARAAEFMEEHSIEEVKTAKGLGEYFAKMSFDTIVKRKFK